MAHVMCNPWKKTFTLVTPAPLTMTSPQWLQLLEDSFWVV